METNQLNRQQYLQTMNEKMIDITETVESLTDVWAYAKKLLHNNLLSEADYHERFVEAVYTNDKHTYHHVLLFGNSPNIFVVIIIDVLQNSIYGHFILDINEEYGL